VCTVTVTDYLAVGPGSAPGIWAVVPGMYGTHLKYELPSLIINFNNKTLRINIYRHIDNITSSG